KGYNDAYSNVIEAVEKTAGVVGMYKGGFATCYYTASNGGEIALPSDVWSGGGDYGYLARAEDPYDLENPYSIVESLRFGPTLEGNDALKNLLSGMLTVAAAEKGHSLDGLQFERVISVEPVDPVAEGSKMYKTLRFGVKASLPAVRYLPAAGDIGHLREKSGSRSADMALYGVDYLRRLLSGSAYIEMPTRNMIEEPFYIDIDVHGQIKDELGLSINSGDYEMVSVTEDTEGYTIEMRRFGHGVGMSQRGAQMMAGQHGKNYLEILEFYYPGMDLERIAWDTPVLKAIEELPDGVGFARAEPTPKPTPAPLPPLESGEYYATVNLADKSSSLNVRSEPGTHAQVVDMFVSGRRVIVSGEADENGWVSVRTAEISGYVKLEYLKAE
ncbi:MAG: SpoIID/LytB domain-containing protein, partial [Clostridia bacterium]|nr:SpoIID/LytB domain-containing protein [Clostridia bacterium]